MPEQDNEHKERVCRACNETYRYPVAKSAATRFHCSTCAQLPLETRSLFEKCNRRIKALAGQVEKLEQKLCDLDPQQAEAGKKGL